MIRRALLAGLAGLMLGGPASAQSVDIDALKSKIAERAGNYTELIDLLEGADGNVALAAFDVMMESENKTLAEMAMTSGLAAADTRLRARALWEAVVRRDNLIIQVDTNAIADNEAAMDHLDSWTGALHTWPLLTKFPQTQCINLRSSQQCYSGYQITVAGLKLDITHGSGAGYKGSFTLADDGVLRGHVMSTSGLQFQFPASITFR